ncbi:flagellar hook-length control protein FliK [Desulfosarcina sp.]|uniref:flagellar hook-length control protein FliK n=1 Tax=Desulfosarcina sp. TaxID=2027861 RepID=UPI003567224A
MNPFGGFMQAVTGLASGFGDNPGKIGKGLDGLPFVDETMLSADDNTRSFLAWVQNFMDNAAGADVDGQRGHHSQPNAVDPDLDLLDHLQALMADIKDQFPQDQPATHSLNGGSPDKEGVPLEQGTINALIAHHQHSHAADTPTRDVLPEIIEMVAAKQNPPAGGATVNAAVEVPPIPSAVPGVPAQAGIVDDSPMKENTPARGQHQPAASGISAQVGMVDDSQIKARSPEPVIAENRPEESVEKKDARFLFKPAASAGDEGQAHTNRSIQERLPTGPGIAGKANHPATLHLQPAAGQAKDFQSMVTGLTGQGSAHPEDDTADFRGKDPHQPTPRVELVDDQEEAWPKGQTSDAAKHTLAEQAKPHPSFQDTAKAMAGDQQTTLSVKPAAGQATALTRTEETAVKTFQTSVMDQIVDKAAMRSIQGRSEIQIRLKPEFLGNVQMNIAADKEQLVVRIMTDRPVVKEIIETHLHHLKAELHSQGLTIDKFEVMVNPDGNQQHSREQFAGMFKHHFSQNGRRQQQEQDPETLNREGGNTPDDVQPNRDGVNYFA